MRNSSDGEVIQRPKAAKRVEHNLAGAIGATQKKAAVDDRGYRYYRQLPAETAVATTSLVFNRTAVGAGVGV